MISNFSLRVGRKMKSTSHNKLRVPLMLKDPVFSPSILWTYFLNLQFLSKEKQANLRQRIISMKVPTLSKEFLSKWLRMRTMTTMRKRRNKFNRNLVFRPRIKELRISTMLLKVLTLCSQSLCLEPLLLLRMKVRQRIIQLQLSLRFLLILPQVLGMEKVTTTKRKVVPVCLAGDYLERAIKALKEEEFTIMTKESTNNKSKGKCLDSSKKWLKELVELLKTIHLSRISSIKNQLLIKVCLDLVSEWISNLAIRKILSIENSQTRNSIQGLHSISGLEASIMKITKKMISITEIFVGS